MNNCAYKMRTTRVQSDVKNLLFDCLLHQLGCCYARLLLARSLRSNYSAHIDHDTRDYACMQCYKKGCWGANLVHSSRLVLEEEGSSVSVFR